MGMDHGMRPFSLLVSDSFTVSNAEMNDKQVTSRGPEFWLLYYARFIEGRTLYLSLYFVSFVGEGVLNNSLH
jgi:hypothetical protein